MRLLVRSLILLICVFAVVQLIKDDVFNGNFAVIKSVNLEDWVCLFSLTFTAYFCLSLMFRESLLIASCKIPVRLSFRLSAMNNFLNTFLPLKGGAVARGGYLKNRFNFYWRDYALVLVFSQSLNILLLAIFLFLSSFDAFLLTFSKLVSQLNELVFYLLLAIVCTIFMTDRIERYVRYFFNSAHLWLLKPASTTRYILYSIAFHLFSVIRLGISFYLVGVEVAYTDVIAIYCLLSMGMSVAFTPGNLGVRELSLVLIASFFSIESATSLNVAIIDRIAGLAASLFIGGFCSYSLSKERWFDRKAKLD